MGYDDRMPPCDARTAELLADLNEPQRCAVQHRDGPLLVVAGPGSGKTRVITRRAAYLVHTGVAPRNVLAITFTNKAASEMRRRIEALGVARGMWIYTFHALGVRLLREFGALAGLAGDFTIYDEDDSLRVVKEALERVDAVRGLLEPQEVRARISDAKNRLETPAAVAAQADWHMEQAFARVYQVYQQLLEQRGAVDFDDLLMKVAIVLRDQPDLAERLSVRFRYLLIDEYQDTNHAQYLIARYLSQTHGNVCATGDPDQSIYGWRGADLRNILEFERDFPRAEIIRLEQNYRSTGHILSVADRLIQRNQYRKHKTLWTQNAAGEPVSIWQFADDRDEAERIARSIAEQRGGGRAWSDFAVFYRINAVSRGLEDALRQHGIPYRIARGVAFYQRKEIRDTLAYLRLLVNPADDVSLLRIINTPARGIGKTTIEKLRIAGNEQNRPLRELLRFPERVTGLKGGALAKLRAFAELLDSLQPLLEVPVPEAVSQVLLRCGLEDDLRRERDSGGEDRLANVQELVTAAVRYLQEAEAPSLADFLSRTALVSDQDGVDETAGAVMLMTLHAAKGLEFPVVYLVGLEQGLLPHDRALKHAGDIEEERRLCFVGLTRARERLFLTRVVERTIRGRPTPRPASQFLRELDDGTLAWRDFQSPRVGAPRVGVLEGFVPLVDDLPPDEAARIVPRRGRWRATVAEDHADEIEEAAERDETALRKPGRESKRAGGGTRPPELRKHEVADETDGLRDVPEGADDVRPFLRLRKPPRSRATRQAASAFADWRAGMQVEHESYGVGEVVWVRPVGEMTRAAIRFPGHGEVVMILEYSPIRRIQRS